MSFAASSKVRYQCNLLTSFVASKTLIHKCKTTTKVDQLRDKDCEQGLYLVKTKNSTRALAYCHAPQQQTSSPYC